MVLRAIQPGQLHKRIHVQIGKHRGLYTHTREEEIQEAGDKIGELLGK